MAPVGAGPRSSREPKLSSSSSRLCPGLGRDELEPGPAASLGLGCPAPSISAGLVPRALAAAFQVLETQRSCKRTDVFPAPTAPFRPPQACRHRSHTVCRRLRPQPR